MFVRKSKHQEVVAQLYVLTIEHRRLKAEHEALAKRWNDLVRKINAKGGEDFLNGRGQSPQLGKDDIRRLLSLCHPDKHDGKQIAQDMTAKLIELKQQLE